MSATRTFLVEAYAPASSEFASLAEQARNAAVSRGAARSVAHIRSIHVPEDEICFHLFAAESADAVADAILEADLRAQRIVEVHS